MENSSLSPPLEDLTKDEIYYFDDGNCVLRTGDHLFRLHRSILRMHSSFFKNMFSLPQTLDKNPGSGETDDEPITCDDSPEAFRALCWALYADPLDTGNEAKLSVQNVQKIAHISLLAHKYEFTALETWARQICRELPVPEILVNFPLEDLKYLAYVVVHCQWKEVKGKLDSHIATGVLREENQYSVSSASTLSRAIQIADYIDDGRLRARSYYAYLLNTNWALHPGVRQKHKVPLQLDNIADFSSVESLSSLSDKQKLCLFRGLSSMQTLRNRLWSMPIIDTLPEACDTSTWHGCHGTWMSWWSDHAVRLNKVAAMDSPLDFLAGMIKRVAADPPPLRGHTNSSTKECIPHIVAQLTRLKEVFEQDLPKYFES